MDVNAAAPGPEPPPAKGFFSSLIDLYFAPGEGFASILKRPSFWGPLLLIMALNAGFTAVWLQKVEPREFMRNQIEASGRMDRIPEDRREEILDRQAGMLKYFAWSGPVFAAVLMLLLAALFLFVYRFFYGSDVDFRQSLAVSAWSFAAVALVTTPLTLGVMALKGDWNMNPQEVLQANATLALERASSAKWLYSLAGSLDLFSFWLMFLLACGYGAAARKSAGWALPGILVPWALYVLVKMGWAALM